MTAKQPFVSVIIPFSNSRRTLMACVNSLLELDYPDYELIFVDNNSDDGSLDILNGFGRVHVLREKKQSAYAARNKGIKKAKGKLIAFTDSDCVVKKNWLNELVKEMRPGVGCVGGLIKAYEVKNAVQERLKNSLDQERQYKRYELPSIVTANALFRKQVFDDVGGFDDSFFSGGDTDLCWRMQKQTKYKIKLSKKVTVLHNFADTYKDYLRIVKKYYGAKYSLKKKYPFVKYKPKLRVHRLFINIMQAVVHSIFDKKLSEKNFLDYLQEYAEIKAYMREKWA